MNLWAFRFVLWYICILLVQPQNRFLFLWPLRIAYTSFLIAMGLHVFSCMEDGRPIVRIGPGTVLALLLLFFATISLHVGAYQPSAAWNPHYDIIVKNCLLLIMIEAMARTVERVWAVQMAALLSTLWWIKGGLRLSNQGATFGGDRLWSVAVSLVDNPNGFAYMMCIFLPLYLYAYESSTKKWLKIAFLACALSAVWIIFETGSRTGLVTLIAIGVFLFPRYGRHNIKSLLAIGAAVALLYPMVGEGNKARFRTIPESMLSFLGLAEEKPRGDLSQDEQSADERKRKNIDTWELIKAYPTFGIGINGMDSKIAERFPSATGQVHCEILMAGRQMGIIGMGLYLGFVSTIFFGGWWIRVNSQHWPAVRNLGWTFQVQGLAIAVGGYFCPIPWTPVHLMLAGSASALVGVLKEERERTHYLV
jgi:hypothetical protein